jgi:thiamine pyrophosphate-dependent acetolactate synthase large subunit-like protein
MKPLDRRAAVARILRDRGDALVVGSLGSPSYDVYAAGDSPASFYLWGAMGGASMLAFGLALAQPRRRVIAFVGDGETMMGLGSLATIGCEKPANLALIVIDNEHYGETGMQRGHAARGVDLAAVARATGFAHARVVRTESELEACVEAVMRAPGPVLVTLKVDTRPVPTSLPPRDGPWLRSRFRAYLLGDRAHA